MTDLREMLLAAFEVEHKEHLEGIRAVLHKIEQGTANPSDIEEAFRRAHSLKAAANVCNFSTVEGIGQRLESLFSKQRKGGVRPGRETLEAIKAALNAIEDWGLGVTLTSSPPEPVHVLAALTRVLESSSPAKEKPAEQDDLGSKLMAAFQIEHKEHLEGIRAILGEIERGNDPTAARVDEAFRRAHSLKGAARIAELHTAEKLAHRLETLFAVIREDKLRLSKEAIRAIYHGLDAIEDVAASVGKKETPNDTRRVLEAIDRILERQSDAPTSPRIVDEQPVEAVAAVSVPPVASVETVRVSADNLDRLLRSTGQLLTDAQQLNVVNRELSDMSQQIDQLDKEWESLRKVAAAGLRQLTETPGLARIARYLTLVEQQVRALTRQSRQVRQVHQRSTWSLGLLAEQLQEDVHRVRMMSAESVFQGFRKMMRDLARDLGKEIDFHVSGLEVEADRVVLQAIKDPVMHVLCNAVTHGLEMPEERRRQGKNAEGRVSLRLEAQGNRLTVTIEDDGRGIDSEKVAEVAVRRGFLTETESESTSPQELTSLLFKPGFSTSQTVTDLSGRGMGLSVVHEAVIRLQGEVDIRSRAEGGTVVVLSVPLSVSTQRLLLVSCCGQTFALPVHGIEQLLRIKLRDLETVEGKPMLLLQGQPIAVLSLAALLGIGQGEVQIEGDTLSLVLLRTGTRKVAVAVDAFLSERNSLIKDLDELTSKISKFFGGIFLEDGSVALVLNTTELIRTFKPSDRAPSWQKTIAAPIKKKRPTVLVVDDSLTTRTLEKSILETHGYDVRIAMDGVEALAKLEAEVVDLVITDVQMPRMDGFHLLEEIKKDRRWTQIPVIVVTSMGRREDQERGLALGADAYIVKRKFDHEELLETIRQII